MTSSLLGCGKISIETYKIKIKIFEKYKLADAKKAHEDLEARKLTGPAILIP